MNKQGRQFIFGSFGYRDLVKEVPIEGPGPGAYDVNDSFLKTSSQSYKSLRIPKGERFMTSTSSLFTPGPGTYSPLIFSAKTTNIKQTTSMNSKSVRTLHHNKAFSTAVGPGAYDVSIDLAKNARGTKFGGHSSKSDRSTLSLNNRSNLLNESLSSTGGKKQKNGTGREILIDDYSKMLNNNNSSPINTSKNETTLLNETKLSNKYTFPKEKRNFSWLPKLNTPGPGQYNLRRNLGVKNSSHSSYHLYKQGSPRINSDKDGMETPGPGFYETQDLSFEKLSNHSNKGSKGFTFNRYAARNFDSVLTEASFSPGPGSFSDFRNNFFEKGPRFPNSRRPFLGSHIGGPGPGSYEVLSDNSFRLKMASSTNSSKRKVRYFIRGGRGDI
jgi:hypothetical protein